jgi:hypothetical protein
MNPDLLAVARTLGEADALLRRAVAAAEGTDIAGRVELLRAELEHYARMLPPPLEPPKARPAPHIDATRVFRGTPSRTLDNFGTLCARCGAAPGVPHTEACPMAAGQESTGGPANVPYGIDLWSEHTGLQPGGVQLFDPRFPGHPVQLRQAMQDTSNGGEVLPRMLGSDPYYNRTGQMVRAGSWLFAVKG